MTNTNSNKNKMQIVDEMAELGWLTQPKGYSTEQGLIK